ncbi:MAG TPA: hypothetical protein DDY91_05735 [Planctomycetaceae bacterium]|nr:hypothetical protein [Planctomycetaceae bacterium]
MWWQSPRFGAAIAATIPVSDQVGPYPEARDAAGSSGFPQSAEIVRRVRSRERENFFGDRQGVGFAGGQNLVWFVQNAIFCESSTRGTGFIPQEAFLWKNEPGNGVWFRMATEKDRER